MKYMYTRPSLGRPSCRCLNVHCQYCIDSIYNAIRCRIKIKISTPIDVSQWSQQLAARRSVSHTYLLQPYYKRSIMVSMFPSLLVWLICLGVGTARNIRKPTGYVDYLPSTGLNVILSSPHGGSLNQSTIPDRDAGCWDGTTCIWSHTCGTKDSSK